MDKTAIVKVYADLVRAGRRKIEGVPEDIRADVEAILGADQNA